MSDKPKHVQLTDDGELIEAVEIPTESIEVQDDYKPKEKRSRIQRYVYSGIGTGIGVGIVAAIVIGVVAFGAHAQHQFAIGEWKLPQLIPTPAPAPAAPTTFQEMLDQSMEPVQAIFNSIIPTCLALPLIIGAASIMVKVARSVVE